MALLPASVDYSSRDFDSLLARLRLLITTVFPTWTDAQVANFGNINVELFAHSGDVLTFYQDNQARERWIATAKLRRSLLNIAKMLDYQPRGRSAATVDVVLTLSPAAAGTVTIAAGDRVLTAEVTSSIAYQFLSDVVFTPGQTTKTVTVENSESVEATFASSGLANQEFLLSTTPYVDASAEVSDALTGPYDATSNPNGWRQVTDFLSSDGTEAHYIVLVDENERALVRFGNGVNGRIPSGTVTIASKIGGGKDGRVEANKLTRLESTYQDSLGVAVNLTVNNAAASSGGEDAESNEQIRANAPASLRVLERAVAREDYEISAKQVAGVARAFHGTVNEGVVLGENMGILFLVTDDGSTASQALLDEVAARFALGGATPKTNTYQLTVSSAVYLDVNIEAVVYRAPGYSQATTRANIEAALDDLFAITNEDGSENALINFGYYYQDEDGTPTGELPWDDVRNAIRDAAGVRKLDPGPTGLLLNGLEADVVISSIQFPRLGTLTLIDGATGDPF